MVTGSHNSSHPTDVDVIIPVYNGQQYILAALRSVEQQTVKPKRIILIDDGSTDQTAEIIQQYRGTVSLEYIKKVNGGLSSARNAGIQLATSQYVAFLDADDEWYPSKLAEQLAVFEQTSWPHLGVVYCQYSIIDANGQATKDYYIFPIDPQVRGRVFEKILPTNKIASSGSGVLMKRECFSTVGLFDEQLQALEDWDFWLRLAEQYEFDYVDKALVKIRRHGANMQRDGVMMFTNRVKFYDKWIMKLSATHEIPKDWVKNIISQTLTRLPRRDFMHLVNRHFSQASLQYLRQVIRRSLKMYLVLRLLITPVTFVRNIFTHQA